MACSPFSLCLLGGRWFIFLQQSGRYQRRKWQWDQLPKGSTVNTEHQLSCIMQIMCIPSKTIWLVLDWNHLTFLDNLQSGDIIFTLRYNCHPVNQANRTSSYHCFYNLSSIVLDANIWCHISHQDMDRSDIEEEGEVHNEGDKEREQSALNQNSLSQMDFYQDNPFIHCQSAFQT